MLVFGNKYHERMVHIYKTIEQVHQEYDGQWVFMINCEKDEYSSVSGGEVVLNSQSRANVVREMEIYDYENNLTFVRYVGKIPKGVSLVL